MPVSSSSSDHYNCSLQCRGADRKIDPKLIPPKRPNNRPKGCPRGRKVGLAGFSWEWGGPVVLPRRFCRVPNVQVGFHRHIGAKCVLMWSQPHAGCKSRPQGGQRGPAGTILRPERGQRPLGGLETSHGDLRRLRDDRRMACDKLCTLSFHANPCRQYLWR